jgi:hypothetical protein
MNVREVLEFAKKNKVQVVDHEVRGPDRHLAAFYEFRSGN